MNYFDALAFFTGLVLLAVVVDKIGDLILHTDAGQRFCHWLFPEDDEG